jgi:MoCo/4Fe-4S cofactor protein with predicted Tat translocation signal
MSDERMNGTTKPTGNTLDNEMNKGAQAETGTPMTLAQVREELKGTKGKKYWRSIDELANTEDFQAAVEREFPGAAQEWVDPVSRRGFLKLMSASMALAGLAGCTKQPDEPIYAYVKAPEDLVLGKPNYFATAHPFVTGAVPVLVKSDQFRPIKVDGNPDHAYNHGSSDVFSQGSLLELYDPDRSKHATYRGESREWAEFAQELRLKAAASKDGTGLYERCDYFANAGAAVEGTADGLSQGDVSAVRPSNCGNLARQGPQRSIRPEPGRRDCFARCGLSLRCGLSRFPQAGGRLFGTSQKPGKWNEPAVCRRELDNHDWHEGRTSPRAACE